MYKELRSGMTSTNTIAAGNTVAANLSALDQAISTETTARTNADTALSDRIGTLDANGNYIQKDASISSNLSTLDTQVKSNANAIQTNTSNISTNTTNISENKTAIDKLKTSTTTNLATKADVNASNLTSLSDADLTAWGNALGKGTIAAGSKQLVTGETIYNELTNELTPTGKVYYIGSATTTAARLTTLDNTLKTFADQLGVDLSNNTNLANQLYKYFKVNPKVTTTNTTTTYDHDAAANGTNSVAIGPSAQAGEKTTDATTSATTVTGGTSSTAIGDSAVSNGDTSVALGAKAQVLNTTDQSGKTTATISGSTAIGSSAKVDGATDATAIGTSAQVNEMATGGIAFGKEAATGEDKGTVTVGDVTADVAAVGGENSVALGTSAKASGNTALALGNGAQVNNYTTQSGTTVSKTVNSGSMAIGSEAKVTGANDAVAFGSGATVTGTGTNADDSMAIGKSASVATAKDAIAFGTSAAVASGADNAIAVGNTAKANTSNTTAIGYHASATGAGAVAIGENTTTETEGGITIGSGTKVSGKSIVIGYATDYNGKAVNTESQNTDAIAIGNGAQANANDSVSIGHQAGKGTTEGRTSGYGSLIAIGTNAGNNVKGMQNVALGSGAGSNVKSSYNVAIGSNAGAGINYAAATDANPQNGYNVSIGYEANYQSADDNAKNIAESIAIGHSANAVSNATALGYKATASGDKSMAFGYNATAADTDSIAIGDKASAGGGNIAIGHGSQAPSVTTYTSSYLTNNTTLNGYISLGGKTTATSNDRILRRITNVADGSDDQDAVTVAQLKQAYTNLEGTIKTTDTKISDTYTQEAIDSKIATVESKITASKTKYFSINTSSDTLTGNADSDGASTTGAADAMAIGPNASATSSKAVAIGNNVSASGKGSIALGTADNPATSATVTEGGNTSANPHVTSAEGANSVAIGTSAIAQTDNSVALGTRASVYTSDVTDTATGTTTKVGQQSIAIGYQSETRNTDAISIGSNAKAYSNGSTAVGNGAFAQGADAIVLGTSSTANGASSGILGKSNTVNGSNTYAVGSENNVTGNWGAVTYSGLYGSKNTVNPVADTSGNTKHGMDSLSVTGNSNTISQGSYSDTVQNISILGNSNSVTGANTDEANAGTTANITIIGGDNKVTGRDGADSDYMGKTWNQLTRTSIIGYGNTVNQAQSTISLANTQILGNDVTATLGNSVYLGTGAAAKTANLADATTLTDAEQAAVDALDTTGMTDAEKATAQANAKATARYATNLKTMKVSGTTAGLQTLNTDTTYDDGTSYTYAGSSPTGVITVGSAGSERRIQNVAAGLVSATSTDAVNGSQLYALTRQLRFGGDNSSFGTTTADDKNVVARGSNETLNIIGGEKDATKLTDNNIGVMADSTNNSLSVKLASDLKKLNTASLGSGSGDSYKETIKLDGTNGKVTVADSSGTVKTTLDTTGLTIAGGPKFTSSGIDAANQQIHRVTAGTDNTDAANVGQVNAAAAEATTEVKAGTNASLGTVETSATDKHKIYTVNVDNLAVKANGTGTTTVALANGINFKNGTNTTSAVDSNGNVTIDTKNLALKANGTNTATVTMDNGINFKNGTNTTATVGTDGTVTISATHNKLDSASYTASKPSDTSNQTTVKLKDTDNNETTLNLTDTYTTVSENTDHTITFKRNDGSAPVSVSLDDLNGASKEALTTAAAKATTTVIKGTNVDSVEDDTTSADGHHIYKVNVSNLGVKVADGQKKSVALSDGLVFGNGTNTTASVGDNGTITFNVSDTAIKTKAKDAIDVVKGNDNVTIDTTTSTDGTKKTFTISAKDTYTTVTKDADKKTVTFTRNDGNSQTVILNDLGGITAAQDKYITGGTVSYDTNGNGTAALTGTNGITASITGLKDTKVSSGAATYVGTQGDASGSATLTMNDGSKATISGLKDDYITSAAVGTETNHVTMTRLGGGTVDLNLNPILEKYSLSDYHLVGAGTTHDKAYAVDSNGTVTLNVVDDKNPTGTPKTIQITGLASQSGVNAGRTTVKSSDSSVIVDDGTSNSDTHTYDIKVDYSKIPAKLKVQYSGDNGTSGSNTMDKATAFTGTANQIVTTAADGKVSFKLGDDISGIQSVSTGDAKLDTNGLTVTNGPTFTKSNIDVNNQQIHKVTAGTLDTDAANVGQVKAATTEVQAGTNVSVGKPATDSTDNHKIYTVNVDNLSLSQNGTKVGTGVALKNGLDFQNGTNTTASITADGKVSFSISNDAIKAQAKDAVVLTAGDNVTIGTPTDANNVKTYTVSVSDLKLQADGADKATRKLSEGINFAGGTNTMADVTADGKVTYDLKDSISLNQVQTGESKLNTNGLTITGGPKVLKSGIDAGNKQITNVASGGTVESNAATIGDLKKAIETASAGTTASGFKTKGNYGEAVTSRLDKQLNIVGDVDTTKVAKDNLSNDNVGVVTSTDTNGNATLTVKLNKDINLGESGSVTTGSTLMNKTGIANGNMSLGADGLTIQNGPKFTNNGINAANQKVTGVANGTDPNDAVNVSQLEAVKSDVTAGWKIAGKNALGTDLTANIGKGKTVSYAGGKYATATLSVDSTTGNATVAVDAVTNTLSVGADGKITSNGDGLTTTGAVKDAINGAYWTIQAGNATGNAQKVSAGSTITFNAGSNLSLSQDGTNFTYALNTDLQNMTSVTAKDQKDNTAVLTGEGLKVSDKDGNSLTQHATEIRLHDATKAATDTTTDVVLNKQGLQNGGHTITGVANGTVDANSQDAINGSQLYELQQKVTNGWKITGDDTTKASNIGNDKTVSFVNGDNSYIKAKVDTTNTGATVSYTAQTASLTTTDGKAALTGTTDGLVTGMNLTSVLNSLSWTAQSSQVGSGQNNGSTLQSITAGSKVGFIAGNNMILTQDGTNFTYALNSSLTGMNTIAFTGLGNGASNLTIGLQNGGGANPDKGYYITGLSNTKWDQSNYEGTRAATEAQLREAIDKVSAATGTGGFGLTADDGANNGGEKKVTQTLGRTIAIQGDGTYGADGTVVKQGNISTVAYTDNAGPTGAIKVKLNNDIDLSEAGSLTIGASKVSAGSIVLDNTGDAAKKIALNSTAGTASIGGVMVNGAAKTVMGLANTTWDGTAVSGRAATEDQLAKAISDASTQASNSELHIRKGTYGVGKDKDGQDLADPKGKNSVSIDVVNAKGAVDGQVVINDVAKASELGTVGELADNLKNPDGGPTTVVQAVNKVNQKVDDSLKQVNGDISNAVTEAKKHTEVQSVDSDNNVTIDGKTTNAAGGKVYKLGLNKQHMNLDKVHIYGTEGRVTAKGVEAETVKIDDKTKLDKDGLKTGNTTVADGRVVVGGDNGIKIEANDGQQTISGLSNRTWNGRAVSGRAATEDQLQQAVENATATAAQNEQHIQAGNYNVGQGKGLDGKAIDKNSVAINVVSGDGTKPGDVKGQVVINNVAKADELGDVAKLNDTVKNADGRPTSTVDAINNLDKRVETTVGDNVYSGVKGKEIADGDSATTAIGKLNNRMNDIYTTAGQHSSVSTADTNLTLSESKNASGGTDYKIGLNKDQINLGNLTIKGNEGSIETKFIKSDSFTAGDTVVNKDGIKVGNQSALTGDSLKVNGKTYVDDKGVNANGQVIRNVGDGKDDGDAVNVKQVNDLAARQGEVIGQNAAHINQLDRAVNRLDSRINRVGAGAAALAALHPGNYDPDDKVDFAAGFGNYRGASAAAVGMYYHPDETTTMSVGASFGGGENMVNAGITWKMGKDSGHMRTQAATKAVPVQFVAAPTQTTQPTGQTEGTKTPQPVTAVTTTASGQQVPIVAAYLPSVDNSTRAENDELKELLARQTAILEKLAEQKTAAAPAAAAAPVSGEDLFPDVPENHWAYDFVAKLAKAGALKDCHVEDPANNPMLTRNDFAQILYTALKNGATKNPALNKDNGLNHLASEFRVELKNVKR